MESSLSTYSYENATNDDYVVTYRPNGDVKNYEYTIIKDSNALETIYISDNRMTNIVFKDTGVYQLNITEYYENSKTQIISGKYVIDKIPPVLEVGNTNLKLKQGSKIDVMGGVSATDNMDGDITGNITTNINDINLNKIGRHKLIYTVSDNASNEVSKIVNIDVIKNNSTQLLITQIIILLVLLISLIKIIKYNKSIIIEKRIIRYSVKPIKDSSKSLFGKFYRIFYKIVNRISYYLSKSYFINKISKRYLKYVKVFGHERDTTITIISQKIVMSIIFLIMVILAKTIRLEVLSLYEMIIPLIVGYYLLDIIYAYQYRLYRHKIENDFLQAIIVMNNAFKSGRSIQQAVELVSHELTGPIALEFKKIALEMSFGLDVEIVFKRFADRIDLDEAAYLTAALSITNKTGGNIIRVFDSIEKTLFNRKKLKLELKSLTGSSRLIMYILMIIPILFVLIISIINSNYFIPLISTPLGILLIVIMIIIYITYIILVRKVINVRM